MRRAFTLRELMVVVTIIAVPAALLLPAVRRVRHSAAVMSCSNNLKVIGIAAHTYRDTHGHFPPGTMPHPTLAPDQRLSWQVALLPHLELKTAFDKFDPAMAWNSPHHAPIYESTSFKVFVCPAFVGPWPGGAPTNYVGTAGVGLDVATLPGDAPGVGFFGYDRKLKVEQVTDGTSQTLAVIETGFDIGPFARGGAPTVRGLDLGDEPLLGEGRPFGGMYKAERKFGKPRPLGTQTLMADGGVRLSSLRGDATVLGALATIAGGETVPAEW
jgi:prepilin-type N-terminal cleavage/methylation domain-containing protein